MSRTTRLACASLLAALISVRAHAADRWSHARTLTVVMVDNRFQPDQLTLQRGTVYRLRLENHGKDMHEFTAAAFFRDATVRDKRLLANGGMEVVVQPGQSAVIFLVPRDPGTYKLTCADHDWDGMVGSIIVN